ncbi:MAG TPA: acyl-CoA thioesterase [Chloroflexota bacterium]|nr:acyl-CoA thioesterase [Chloroflexota bacterium]
MKTRTVGQTKTIVSQLMLPTDANPSGQVHGGAIMKLVDTVGGVVAMRHSRLRAVTARMDEMSFLHPVFVGDLLILKASVNNVGRTSMEVGVRVEAENLRTGVVTHTASAYMLYVALDDEGKPTEVPRLVAETEDEVRRKAAARRRKAARERPTID